MPSELLLAVNNAMIRYRETPVFENLSFNIYRGSRIALVGKNGAGKSTLMNVISGNQQLDDGEIRAEAGVSVGYLHQDIIPENDMSVFDYIFTEIQGEEREMLSYKVDIIAEALELDSKAMMISLSGGQLRRAGLARALVEEPDILLMDEPTNHLDIGIINWLENYLCSYKGTVVCVSHDRAFLENITNKVFWLDRGELKISPSGFKHFDEWSLMLLEQEERELKNRRSIVKQEVEWASRGVKARRKRNVRRLAIMKEMREQLRNDEASFRRVTLKINLTPQKSEAYSSNIVAEFFNVSKSFTDDNRSIKVLDNFSIRIKRGDRIGIIGKNGTGKTSLIKLLTGDLIPDSGNIKVKKDLEFSYFDQNRSSLDINKSLKRNLVPGGGDYIEVMGKQRHVCGYLKDFMFDPSRAEEKVVTLSGGQKNRLMLAKVLADPKSCLILDEPTNDLDIDTLDMLEEILLVYKGTLIIVSHDRDFLDQTVTKILAFSENGHVEQHIGNYSEYLEKQSNDLGENNRTDKSFVSKKAKKAATPESGDSASKATIKPVKLSYKLERELSLLPDKIKSAEQEKEKITKQLSDPMLYINDSEKFNEISFRLNELSNEIEEMETRWLELEEMKNGA